MLAGCATGLPRQSGSAVGWPDGEAGGGRQSDDRETGDDDGETERAHVAILDPLRGRHHWPP